MSILHKTSTYIPVIVLYRFTKMLNLFVYLLSGLSDIFRSHIKILNLKKIYKLFSLKISRRRKN